MSDKTPHWPGADGKPGVSFAPKNSSGSASESAAGGESTAKMQPVKGGGKPQSQAKIVHPGAAPSPVIQKPGQPPQGGAPSQAPNPGTSQRNPGQRPAVGQAAPAGASSQLKQAAQAGQASAAQKSAVGAGEAGAAVKSGGVWGTPAKASTTVRPDTGGNSAGKVGGVRRTRKARLRLARIDPWSVMKTSFLFSIAFGIMLVVIVAVLWSVIVGSGALDAINSTMTQLIGDEENKFNIENFVNSGRVIGLAAVLAAVDVVIMTAVATLFAFLYNLAAAVIGGLEVTLAED